DSVVEQEVHDPAVRFLNGRPQLASLGAALVQPPPPLGEPLGGLRQAATHHLAARLVLDPHGVFRVRPIHPDVVAHATYFLSDEGPGASTASSPCSGPREL